MIKNSKLNFNIKAILTALILLLTSFSVFAVADNQISYDQITVTYSFETPTIKEVTIGDGVYDRVTIQGLSASGNSGEPRLPVGGAYILLPQGTSLDDINVISESVFLGSGFNVEPVGQMIPISQISSAISPTPNENIYNSKDMFPGNLFEEVGTYSFRGYEMLVLNLHPIQYVPVTGELYFYEEMMISVNLVKDGNINPLFRDLEKDRIEIMNKVDNPEVVETYDYSIQHPLDSYDFLIITTDSLKNSFQPLENFHDANGISTIIKTTTDIGSSNPDDIRDYIRDAYNNWGIDYALIGADDDIIAAKDLFVRTIWWWPWSETEENMPSDLYYACLDGTYDYNGNGQFGEPDDGPGGGDVDLVAEVYVGRAPVGNTAEVNNFVDKTIAYLYSDDPYLEDVLMTGEELNDAPLTWGGDYMDELIDGSSANGYTTVGIPSGQYDIDTLYDRDWGGHDWPKSEIISRINNDLHFINHLGHANYYYVMKMSNSDVSALTNDKLCFVYSQGCMSGGFDDPEGSDCIAEYFTVKTDNAAFAVIMNARYGWYNPGGTDGPSQHYHREFWDAVFGEGKTTLGAANHDSKEDNIYRINEDCMRWCYYQLNLLGDPAIDFFDHISNTPPNTPDTPSGPASGRPLTQYTYSTSTTDPESQQVYYKWDWGDEVSDWFGPYDSGETVEADHEWDEPGEYQVKVKAKDTAEAESGWSNYITVNIYNNAPDKPDRPSGPPSGKVGEEYTYSSSTTDSDGDQVYYKWDWGDEIGDWLGPYDSGETVEAKHTWTAQGSYDIKVKSKDIFNEESEWSDPLPVTMPKNKVFSMLFDILKQAFPRLFSIFESVMGNWI